MEKGDVLTFSVAEHRFMVCGKKLCEAVRRLYGFKIFETEHGHPAFSFVEGGNVPGLTKTQHSFVFEDVSGTFGIFNKGYLLSLKPLSEEGLFLWCDKNGSEVFVNGNYSPRLLRFAIWVGYGLMTLPYRTMAVHSSCIVYGNKAVMFLGESGAGKSTHTELWRQHIPGAFLLNDDSPIIRAEVGKLWVHGSPWSGKTHCYRAERYELTACVRIYKALHNDLKPLSTLHGYGAIHPSCPPIFAYDAELYDYISDILSVVLESVPVFRLDCLPNKEAAELVFQSLFQR